MAASPPGTEVVEHEIRVDARPETVFGFFTDPVRMVQWMGIEAVLDPRSGGVFRIAFHPPDEIGEFLDATYETQPGRTSTPLRVVLGEYLEVDPPRRIAFTWGWEHERYAIPPQSTEVEVTFTSEGKGTVVHLAHRRLPRDTVPLHRAGWTYYLPRLAIVAAGGDPGQDAMQIAVVNT
jgi:uncharacterized protein YndB with AHSA1/START domain